MSHRRPITVALALALLGVGAVGCGTDKEAEAREARAEKARKVRAEELRRERVATAKATKVAAACEASYGELLKAARALGSRLDVGMTNADYGERLGDIKVAYDAAGGGKGATADDFECLERVAVPLETSYNEFAKASIRWDACLEDIGCDTDSIESKLQARWTRAGKQIERAEEGLVAVGTPDTED